MRPNLDVRVGVAVTGTALVPRIRLFSDPDMSDADKLSWLLRGRASEGPGSGDTALLQAAAMALISGDEPNALDQFFNVFGSTTCRCGRATTPAAAPSSRWASSCRATGTWATSAG